MFRKWKRNLSTVLVLLMMSTLIPIDAFVKRAYAAATMQVGDYVQFGSYYGKPILWKVINVDADGSPMLYSEKILCLKPFDAAESGNANQIGDNPYSTDYDRQQYGSNNWENSNIREWLNSSDTAVKYTTQPPTKDAVCDSYNAYEDEAGFLSNFSQSERAAIKPVTHKSILADIDKGQAEGGSAVMNYDLIIDTCVQNYDTAYYKNVSDRVYLLDAKELHDYVYTSSKNEYRRKPTQEAVDNSDFKWRDFDTSDYWFNWLRTPHTDYSLIVRFVGRGGGVSNEYAYERMGGVVPALNLKSGICKSGKGTVDEPYIPVDNNTSQTNWKNYKESKEINTLNKDFTVKFNKVLNTSTVTSENIYVATDEDGQNKVNNVSIKTGSSGKEILVNYDNNSLWESGKTYYLFINTNVQSVDGNNLKNPIRMQFNVK